jgi:hypothetical protein
LQSKRSSRACRVAIARRDVAFLSIQNRFCAFILKELQHSRSFECELCGAVQVWIAEAQQQAAGDAMSCGRKGSEQVQRPTREESARTLDRDSFRLQLI